MHLSSGVYKWRINILASIPTYTTDVLAKERIQAIREERKKIMAERETLKKKKKTVHEQLSRKGYCRNQVD